MSLALYNTQARGEGRTMASTLHLQFELIQHNTCTVHHPRGSGTSTQTVELCARRENEAHTCVQKKAYGIQIDL